MTRAGLLLLLAVPVVACSEQGGGDSASHGVATSSSSQILPATGVPALLQPFAPEHAPLLAPEASLVRWDKAHARIMPRMPIGVRAAVESALPESASDPAVVRAGRVAIDVRLVGASGSLAEVDGRYVVYRNILGRGVHSIHAATRAGTEEFIYFPAAPMRPSVSYQLAIPPQVRLRLFANALELVDEAGIPRLRMQPPFLIRSDGQRLAARVSVEGCQVDSSAVPPFGRSLVAPGSSSCLVHIGWDESTARYPLLLDPAWVTTSVMAHSFYNGHKAVLLANGRVMVTGGLAAGSSAEVYDPASNTWSVTGLMSGDRFRHGLVLLPDGKVLAAGGYRPSAHKTAETWDPSTGLWTPTGELVMGRDFGEAVVLSSGEVLFAGGASNTFATVGTTAELYFPGSRTWAPTGSMPHDHRRGTLTLLANGRALIAGGTSNGTTTALYNRATQTWANGPAMALARYDHVAIRLPSGSVLVAGSQTYPELYNPTLNTWTPAGAMLQPRSLAAVGLIPGGRIIVAGGYKSGDLATTEIYDPSTSLWSAGPSMNIGRSEVGFAALPGDKLIVVGGSGLVAAGTTAEVFGLIAEGGSCGQDNECLSGHCVDQVCCGTACEAPCHACSSAKKGSGADGTCGPVASGQDPNGDCLDDGSPSCGFDGTCDGSGGCRKYPVASGCTPSPCTDGPECTTGYCRDGMCCNSGCTGVCLACAASLKGQGIDGECGNVKQGTDPRAECAPGEQVCGLTGECNGQGACEMRAVDVPCGLACKQGNLQNMTCDGLGACIVGTTFSCGWFLCGSADACGTTCGADTDCAASAFCNDTTHLCEGDLGDGSSCFRSGQCASGNCVDMVCCESACSGECLSCAAASTGEQNGLCRPVVGGTDPDEECAASGDACKQPGVCDGTAAGCRQNMPASSPCGAVTCAGAKLLEPQCDGAGNCVQQATACAPVMACNATADACAAQCTTDSECGATAWCSGGSCVARQLAGTICSETRQCLSGFCADGRCCNSACDQACEACNVVGEEGQCKVINKGATQGAGKTCKGTGDCAGSCDGVSNACSYPGPATACAAKCISATQLEPSTCNSAGDCAKRPPEDCSPFACDQATSACRTGCTVDSDCATPQARCNKTSKKCVEISNTCVDPFTASDGVETWSCKPYACKAGLCMDTCTAQDPCASGYQCKSGQCHSADGGVPADAAKDSGGTLDASGSDASPDASHTDASPEPVNDLPKEDSGCGCRTRPLGPSNAMLLMGLLLTCAVARRRGSKRSAP